MSPDPSKTAPTPRSRAIDPSTDACRPPSRRATRALDRRRSTPSSSSLSSHLSRPSRLDIEPASNASCTLRPTPRGPFASIRPYLEGCPDGTTRPTASTGSISTDATRRDSTRKPSARPSNARSVTHRHRARSSSVTRARSRFGRDRAIDREVDLESLGARARVCGSCARVRRTLGTTAARAATRFCARAGLAASGINPVFNAKATMTACV